MTKLAERRKRLASVREAIKASEQTCSKERAKRNAKLVGRIQTIGRPKPLGRES